MSVCACACACICMVHICTCMGMIIIILCLCNNCSEEREGGGREQTRDNWEAAA